MTITSRIHEELFAGDAQRQLIRMPLTHQRGDGPPRRVRKRRAPRPDASSGSKNGPAWTAEEHERFLQGLELFPRGPWKDVARHVGSRTVRQTMTHAQKYRQKIARHKRGLQTDASRSKKEQQRRQHPEVVLTPPSVCVPSKSTPSTPMSSPSSADAFAVDSRLLLRPAWVDASPAPVFVPEMLLQPMKAAPAAMELAEQLDAPLDDAVLDALVVDDVLSSVISQYLGPCPADSESPSAAWSFADATESLSATYTCML